MTRSDNYQSGPRRNYRLLSHRGLLAAGVLAALITAGYLASRPRSTGSAAGVQFNGPPARPIAERTTLRVGTFNIHSGRGADGIRDLPRTARALSEIPLDLVALQEVRGNLLTGDNQASRLAETLEMAWLYAPAERRWYALEFGNALLAATGVQSWQRIALPRQFAPDYRNAVLTVVEHGGHAVRVLATHIHQRQQRERDAQLLAVAEIFLHLEEPAILLGDLNCPADQPPLRQLLQMPGVIDAVGEAVRRKGASEPPGRVDWIITRGLRPIDGGIVDQGASDHPLVWAELELP